MKTKLLLLSAALIGAVSTVQILRAPDRNSFGAFDMNDPDSVERRIAQLERDAVADGGESRAGWYGAYLHFISLRLNEDGRFDPSYLREATAHREKMPISQWTDGTLDGRPGGTWANVGPFNVGDPVLREDYGYGPTSGRVNDIAISSSDPNIMFIATAGGGLWKTTNGGSAWKAVSDKWPILLSSSVAIHPTNSSLVLAGTGDAEGFVPHFGNGIMRTIDGGSTWVAVGPTAMRDKAIKKILFLPSNPDVVLAITSDGIQGAAPAVYRSTDAGQNWEVSNAGLSGSVKNWSDMDVSVDGTVYLCGTGDSSSRGFIYRSSNGGQSWSSFTNPCQGSNPALDIACSQLTANTVFLLDIGSEKIWKSVAGGQWKDIKGNFKNGTFLKPSYNWRQKDYNYHITASKNGSSDVVYVGLIGINMDVEANGTWTDISKTYEEPYLVHTDQHCAVAHPTDPSTVFFGNDGGIFKWQLSDPVSGAGTWTRLNATIANQQAYHVSVHPTDSSRIMAGLQDNATVASRGNLSSWSTLFTGDGSWSAFDGVNPGIQFVSMQNGRVAKYASDNTAISTTIHEGSEQEFRFIAPLAMAGSSGNELFLGGKNLWKWKGNKSWQQLSMSDGAGTKCLSLTVSPTNRNVIYGGYESGRLMMTADKGNSSRLILEDVLERPIGAVGVANSSPYDVVVGFMGNVGGARVRRCRDTRAATPVWENVSGYNTRGLPDAPVNTVARDPYDVGRWYVGTDVGCFMTTDYGTSWSNLTALGLPNVRVTHLVVDATGSYLYASTFGRGIWRIPLVTSDTSYSISGRVFDNAQVGVPALTVTLQLYKESSATNTSSPNANIPMLGYTGELPVITNAVMTRAEIYTNISGVSIGDLEVIIEHPDGSRVTLNSPSNDPSASVPKTYKIGEFAGRSATGTWKLHVRDTKPFYTGKVIQWKVIPYFMANSSVGTTTTNASGNYSFANLEAGQYKVFPSQSGKTFAPSSWTGTVGPDRSGVDFRRRTSYQIVDIAPDKDYSRATGVNDHGVVCGYFQNPPPANASRPFRFSVQGGFEEMDMSGISGFQLGQPAGINNTGDIVATVYSSTLHGIYYFKNATSEWLASTPGESTAMSINDAGYFTGLYRSLWYDEFGPVLWSDVNTRFGGWASSTQGSGAYISNNHAAVWNGRDKTAFIDFLNGTTVPLPSSPLARYSIVSDINDNDIVVGYGNPAAGGYGLACVWINGLRIDLGAGSAQSVNNDGWVVGDLVSQSKSGFIWSELTGVDSLAAGITNLDSSWTELHPWDISNTGYIVGAGIRNGKLRAFLLVPQPN